MTPEEVLRVLLDRLGATDGAAILISEQELAQWPAVAVAALKSQRTDWSRQARRRAWSVRAARTSA